MNSSINCRPVRTILKIQWDPAVKHLGWRSTATTTATLNCVWNCWPPISGRISVPIWRLKNGPLRGRFKSWPKSISTGNQRITPLLSVTSYEVFWRVLVLWRWVYTKGKTLWDIQLNFPAAMRFAMPLVVRKMKGQAAAQGMGRHSKEDVIEMGLKDLRAISDYLGIFP